MNFKHFKQNHSAVIENDPKMTVKQFANIINNKAAIGAGGDKIINKSINLLNKGAKMTLQQKKQNYIIDSIDVIGYDEEISNDATLKEKLQFIADCFKREAFYPSNIKRFRHNKADIIADHLQGLPSYLNIDYNYYNVLKVGRSWGVKLDSEKLEDNFTSNWWNMISDELINLFNKYEVKL